MSKSMMARSWRLFHLSARRADAGETVSMAEPVGDHSFHRRIHLGWNSLASIGLGVLAEQQRGDFHQIAAPDGEIVQTFGGIKSVPDVVGRQKFGLCACISACRMF